MVVRTKRRMITRAKTKGEMALMKSRMQRLQKERVNVTFEEAEVLQGGPGRTAHRRAPARARPKKQTITQARHLGSSLVLSLQAKRASEVTVDIYVHFPSDWYAIMDVPINLFNRWERGDASAKTTDIRYYKSGTKKGRRKKPRWWVGKKPSQGAFYNQYIKGKFPHLPISGPPAGSQEVFDDDFDIYGEQVGAPITNG